MGFRFEKCMRSVEFAIPIDMPVCHLLHITIRIQLLEANGARDERATAIYSVTRFVL